MRKKTLKIALPLAILTLALTPVIAISAAAAKSNQGTDPIFYDNQTFDTPKDAANYFLKKNQDYFKKEIVIGDRSKAKNDLTYDRLDKNKLNIYDANKVSPAYVNLTGSSLLEKKEALDTYTEHSKTKFTFPGATKNYDSEIEAQTELLKNVVNDVVYKTEILKPGTNKEKIWINPTNASDIKNLKTALWNEFKNKPDISGTSYDTADVNKYVPKQEGWTRGYVYQDHHSRDKKEIKSYEKELRSDLLDYGNAFHSAIKNIFLEKYVYLEYIKKLMEKSPSWNVDEKKWNSGEGRNISSGKNTLSFNKVNWVGKRSSGVSDLNPASIYDLNDPAYTFWNPEPTPFLDGGFGIKLTADINEFKKGFSKNSYIENKNGFNGIWSTPKEHWIIPNKSTYSITDNNGNEYAFFNFFEFLNFENLFNNETYLGVHRTKRTTSQPSTIKEVINLKIDSLDRTKFNIKVTDLNDPSRWNLWQIKSPENDDVFNLFDGVNSLTYPYIKDDKTIIEGYQIDFRNSYINIEQNVEFTNFWGNNTYLSTQTVSSISGIKINVVLNTQELLKRFAHDFYLKYIANDTNNLQLGYFYDGQLIFTQKMYNQNEVSDSSINPIEALKNVSLKTDKTTWYQDELIQLWNHDSIEGVAQFIANAKTFITTGLDGGIIDDEEIYRFINVAKQKFGVQLSNNKNLEELAKILKITIEYDPKEKWLSFWAANKRSSPAIITKWVNTYFSFAPKKFNPSFTTVENFLIYNNEYKKQYIYAGEVQDWNEYNKKFVPKITPITVYTYTNNKNSAEITAASQSNPFDSSPFDSADLMEKNIQARARIELENEKKQSWIIDPEKVYVNDKLVENDFWYVYIYDPKLVPDVKAILDKDKRNESHLDTTAQYFESYDKLKAYIENEVVTRLNKVK